MKNNKIKGLVIALTIGFMNLIPIAANASTTYETWSTRGVKYLAWSKDTLDWTVNSNLDITSYDARQEESGLFVSVQGYSKLSYSNADNLYVNFKHKFTAGAVIGGQTLGWDTTITDQAHATWSGNADWSYDV